MATKTFPPEGKENEKRGKRERGKREGKKRRKKEGENDYVKKGRFFGVDPVGAQVVVDGYQSKDRSARANGRDVTFEDGRKFFMGSSGTGAPLDGRDSTERGR